MEIQTLQSLMRNTYLSRDWSRGVDATFRWLREELGELAPGRSARASGSTWVVIASTFALAVAE